VKGDRIRRQAEARVIHTPHGKDNQDSTRTRIRITFRDPERKATGFSVGHLPESFAISPGGKDTYEDGTRIRVTFRDPTTRQQDSASGICQSHPRLRYAERTLTRTAQEYG